VAVALAAGAAVALEGIVAPGDGRAQTNTVMAVRVVVRRDVGVAVLVVPDGFATLGRVVGERSCWCRSW
jgi:hypothetical protein